MPGREQEDTSNAPPSGDYGSSPALTRKVRGATDLNDLEVERRGGGRPWTVERVSEARLPTEVGEFRIAGYRSKTSEEEFVVLYKGEMRPEEPTLARIHSQ
ncbi:MAG TPA: hypothetical protein VF668_11420, partial [Pyrinomonadaceae bacterium]